MIKTPLPPVEKHILVMCSTYDEDYMIIFGCHDKLIRTWRTIRAEELTGIPVFLYTEGIYLALYGM